MRWPLGCLLWSVIGQVYLIHCPDEFGYDPEYPCIIHSTLPTLTKFPSKINSPKLNLLHEYQDISTNDSFSVECLGQKPLEWHIAHAHEEIGERLSVIESFDSKNKDFPYTSKLTLRDALYTDTTLITCFYNGTDTNAVTSGAHMSASFYLFVNDDQNLLAPCPVLIGASPSRPLKIPCRSTNSKANVTLWKNDHHNGRIPVFLEEGRIEYNPTLGFVIYFPHIFFSGAFYCHVQLGELEEEKMLILEFRGSISDIAQPTIRTENATYVKVGSSFSLKCLVYVDILSIGNMYWEYPGSGKTSKARYFETNMTSAKAKNPINNITYLIWENELRVFNVQSSDEGEYTCHVGNDDAFSNKHSFYVQIFGDEMQPFINISTGLRRPLMLKENDDGKMVYEIHTTFNPKDLVHDVEKDGKLIRSGTNGIVVNTTNGNFVIINIAKLNRFHSGNYTVIVKSGEIQDSKSIVLLVKASPITTVVDPPRFFNVGQEYTLNCLVDGFPNVSVWWEVNSCNEYGTCSWSNLDNNMTENQEVVGPTNRSVVYKVRKDLILQAIDTKEYRCVGQNPKNISLDIVNFTVTDIAEGFGIISPAQSPIAGANITLSCKANRKLYTTLEWYYIDENSIKVLAADNNDGDWITSSSDTRYSLTRLLQFRKIRKDFQKTFACQGTLLDGSITNSTYSFNVQDSVPPRFISNGSSHQSYTLKSMDTAILNCTASGVPQPRVYWLKDKLSYDHNTSSSVMEVIDKGSTLKIKVAYKKTVEGVYQCRVENLAGSLSRTFRVEVQQEEAEISTATIVLAIILPIILILLLVACFCCIRHKHKERMEKAELEELSRELFNKGEVHLINSDMNLDDQVELLPYDHKWEFPKERLKLGRILGQGAFGRVVKAEAIGLDDNGTSTVAVKMLKERADKTQRKALMAELKILIHLQKHLNIVNLLGAVTKNMIKGELLVIVEYCRYGNLRNFLLKRKNHFINQLDPKTGQIDPDLAVLPGSPIQAQLANNQGLSNPIYGQQRMNYADLMHDSNSGNSYNVSAPNSPNTGKGTPFRWLSISEEDDLVQPITTCDLLCYAFQVARGMQHLSNQKLIHRDLAARNVLLANDNVVKICDFGLAKDCYKYDNYKIKGNGPLPIKWMALESLLDKVFTSKSDVWSFGILLWEFFTLGGDPYPGVDIDETFTTRLRNGYRLRQPELAPKNAYRIMLECWNTDPDRRPDFETLGDLFGDFLQAGVKDFYLDLDIPYAEMNALSKTPDYLAMSQPNYLTMNTEEPEEKPTVNYDNIISVRPIDNGPVPLEPMEVVPMIQLEPLTFKRQRSKGRPAPETPEIDSDLSKRETDYLMMEGSNGEKPVFSRQRKGNESLRSDASSGFHSDLDNSAEITIPPSYTMVMGEEQLGIEV